MVGCRLPLPHLLLLLSAPPARLNLPVCQSPPGLRVLPDLPRRLRGTLTDSARQKGGGSGARGGAGGRERKDARALRPAAGILEDSAEPGPAAFQCMPGRPSGHGRLPRLKRCAGPCGPGLSRSGQGRAGRGGAGQGYLQAKGDRQTGPRSLGPGASPRAGLRHLHKARGPSPASVHPSIAQLVERRTVDCTDSCGHP